MDRASSSDKRPVKISQGALIDAGVKKEHARLLRLVRSDVEPELPYDAEILLDASDQLARDGAAFAAEYEGLIRLAYIKELPGGSCALTHTHIAGVDEVIPSGNRQLLKILGRIFQVVILPGR